MPGTTTNTATTSSLGLTAALALVLSFATAAAAQETCRVRLDISPDYGGVKLDMTAGELSRMFPGSDELRAAAATGAGGAPVEVSLGMLDLNIRKEDFEGVRELSLAFSGGRLTKMGIHFGGATKWKSIAEFTEHVEKHLALPRAWGEAVTAGGKQSRVMECSGFMVFAQYARGGPVFLGLAKAEAGAKPTPAKPAATRH